LRPLRASIGIDVDAEEGGGIIALGADPQRRENGDSIGEEVASDVLVSEVDPIG
jgi:hypothetical protein